MIITCSQYSLIFFLKTPTFEELKNEITPSLPMQYTAKSFRLTTAIWKILAWIQIVERCQPLLVAKVLLDTICEDEILNLHSKQF